MIIRTKLETISEVNIIDTPESSESPFETCLILAIAHLVGEHEQIKQEHLSKINFSSGWNGEAIAVASQNDDLFNKLGPGLHIVEKMNYGDLGVLDGHHRLNKAQGDLYYVITQLFPLFHPNLIIDTWLENFTPLKPRQVKSHFSNKTTSVPSKATKFQVIDKKGQLRPIREIQPKIKISREILLG